MRTLLLITLLAACGDNIVERPDAPYSGEDWVDGEIIPPVTPPVVPCVDKHTSHGLGLGHLKHCVKK